MKLEDTVGRQAKAHVEGSLPISGTYLGRDVHGYWIRTDKEEVFIPWERLDRMEFKIPA